MKKPTYKPKKNPDAIKSIGPPGREKLKKKIKEKK
jgi:hypothetical protein